VKIGSGRPRAVNWMRWTAIVPRQAGGALRAARRLHRAAAVGALAAGLGGRLPATGVLILAAAVVLAISAVSEPLAAPVLG